MKKLDKFLSKLNKDIRLQIEKTIEQIIIGDISKLDIKKLKGKKEVYRVRIGRVRIIFNITKDGNMIQNISFRDDNTY